MVNSLSINVLYIEDSSIQSRSGARAVRHIGGEYLLVTTGAAALEAANTRTFNLILCDLVLPDMDGIDLIQQLRYKFPTIPIIVITAFNLPGQRETCLQAGATDFVMKPVDTSELEELLRKYLSAS